MSNQNRYTEYSNAVVQLESNNDCEDGSHSQTFKLSNINESEPTELDTIVLSANSYPIGTVITIKFPHCPECDLEASQQDTSGNCQCGYDWLAHKHK